MGQIHFLCTPSASGLQRQDLGAQWRELLTRRAQESGDVSFELGPSLQALLNELQSLAGHATWKVGSP